jgi:hypothetical protein
MGNKYNAQQLIYSPDEGIAHTVSGLNKSHLHSLLDNPKNIRFDSIFEFKVYCKLIEVFPREFIQVHRKLINSSNTPFDVVVDFAIADPTNPDFLVSFFEAKGYVTESYPYRLFGFFNNNSDNWEKYHIVTLNPERLLRRKIFKHFQEKGVSFLTLNDISRLF